MEKSPLLLGPILALTVACNDDGLAIHAPPLSTPDQPGPKADDGNSEGHAEAGDESSEALRDLPDEEPEPGPDGRSETGGDEPEHPEHDFALAVEVVASVEERVVTFTALDADGHSQGFIRVRQDDKRRLWVDSVYHDGFAWVGLHRHTYDVEFYEATISVQDIQSRAQAFANLLGAKAMNDNTDCGLHLATAVSVCAVAASTGVAPKAGCPASMHKAACKCMAPYPAEYVCA